jgi:hypothetical protein
MRRREFIALAGTAIAFLSVSTRAQQVKLNKPVRIATLSNLDPIARGWFVDAMREIPIAGTVEAVPSNAFFAHRRGISPRGHRAALGRAAGLKTLCIMLI